jgi:hypothetical protein
MTKNQKKNEKRKEQKKATETEPKSKAEAQPPPQQATKAGPSVGSVTAGMQRLRCGLSQLHLPVEGT